EETCPIVSAHTRQREECKPNGRDRGANHQWEACTNSVFQASRPTRQGKHNHNERQHGCAGCRSRIALHLNEVESKEKECVAQCRVEKQCQHIGASEVERTEK